MHVDEVHTQQYSLTNPLSYVVVNENETWFCVNGLSYCVDKEGNIENILISLATFCIIYF